MIKYQIEGNTTKAYFDKPWKEMILHTLEVQYGRHCINKRVKKEITSYLSSQPHDATVVCKDDCPCEIMGKEMAKKKLLKRYYNALMHCNWIIYNYHNEKLRTVSATFCNQLDSISTKLDDYIFALKGVQKH
jgi:hypothetical protein